MDTKTIPAYIVTGFLEAGKTTFIQSYITNDFFHKRERGTSLIFVFEEGLTEYDTEILKKYRTEVSIYESGDIKGFILEEVKKHLPDRIFIEANCMTEGLEEVLDELFTPVSRTMLINGETLELYYRNMLQMLQDMIVSADPVIINRVSDKEKLLTYGTAFRLMNKKAGFLTENIMGYHEKVFGRALPFDREKDHICLSENDFPHWYLDMTDEPGFYAGKTIEADVEVRRDEDFFAGRMVMTCCMNDIAFLGFKIKGADALEEGFFHIRANVATEWDPVYKRKVPVLEAKEIKKQAPPGKLLLKVVPV